MSMETARLTPQHRCVLTRRRCTWTVRYIGRCDLALPADVAHLWSLPPHTDDPMCR
jgi:hypothetical protein